MKLGSKLFCMDTATKDKNIFEATLIGVQITTTGYELYTLLDATGDKKFLERAHCHTSKEEAEQHRSRVAAMMDEGNKVARAADAKIDELRVQVIGSPEFLELARRIMGVLVMSVPAEDKVTKAAKRGVKNVN